MHKHAPGWITICNLKYELTLYIHAVSSIGVRVATRSHCNPPAGRFDITTHRITESGSDPSSTVSSVGVTERVAAFGQKTYR